MLFGNELIIKRLLIYSWKRKSAYNLEGVELMADIVEQEGAEWAGVQLNAGEFYHPNVGKNEWNVWQEMATLLALVSWMVVIIFSSVLFLKLECRYVLLLMSKLRRYKFT